MVVVGVDQEQQDLLVRPSSCINLLEALLDVQLALDVILEGDEEDADLVADLEVFVDGVLAEVASTDGVGAAFHEPVAAIHQLSDGRVVRLILVDLDLGAAERSVGSAFGGLALSLVPGLEIIAVLIHLRVCVRLVYLALALALHM